MSFQKLKIFTANSNPKLAMSIAKNLHLPIGLANVTTFNDGETSVSLGESVRGADCFIVQSTCDPVNNNLMELLIMIDAMKRASAERITAVMPYFGYARQDRKANPRDPISAKLVADLLTASGVNRILAVDLHVQQIQGFFNIPVDHLIGSPIFAAYVKSKSGFDPQSYVVLAPDLGAITRARQFAKRLGCQLAMIDKRRPKAGVCEIMNIIGNVENKKVIMVDDMIDTAGTICKAADAAIEEGGALEVYGFATHAVLSGNAIEKIQKSKIKNITVLDTIPVPDEKMIDKIKILSISQVIAETIQRIHESRAISTIFP